MSRLGRIEITTLCSRGYPNLNPTANRCLRNATIQHQMRMGSIQQSMDVTELTISTFHEALRQQTTSCTAIVHTYLDRITQNDPTLKTLITINHDALDLASKKDEETTYFLRINAPFPPLHGIPIILKDNYTTQDLPTSAGISALRTLQTTHDSKVVTLLKKAGAIILAKANLHELALHGTTTSSLGGQTLNPYDATRTPGGSSGGTAAALAANLGLVGCGTDTMNSLRSPASACGIVGFRPSKGIVSTEGIVPVSETQDVTGPMGRCVRDVRVLFDVMREKSCLEKITASSGPSRPLRIGVLDAYFHLEEEDTSSQELVSENRMIQEIIHNALAKIKSSLDLTLIAIDPKTHPIWEISHLLENADTQPFEFKASLNTFLQSPSISNTPHRTLDSIIQSGEYHPGAVTDVFFAAQREPETYSRESQAYQARMDLIAVLKASVRHCFEEHALDALVYPHQRQLPVHVGETRQPRRNGMLAALTGSPAICIPGGFRSLEFGSTADNGIV